MNGHRFDLNDTVHSRQHGKPGRVIAQSTQPMILVEFDNGDRAWIAQGTAEAHCDNHPPRHRVHFNNESGKEWHA